MRTVLGYAIVLLGLFLAADRLTPPAPLPANAPAQNFSAGRAISDIRIIAQHPHPVSSADHDRVRAYIFARLAQMRLGPSIRPGRGFSTEHSGYLAAAPVSNIVGILPGRNRNKPAVLLMSHYDTVPNSPGAADDTAGVASMLEIARALRAGPQPERDIVFLFTDDEELDLLGAEAFFDSDPLARRIGPVINFEARGDSGLTTMFETGLRNDGTIAAYGHAVARPDANSLSRFIYHHMPNDTDFTHALQHGLSGINLAFIGDESAYHSSLATPGHLNLGSVQHMGDQGLAVARAFAAKAPLQHRDLVYSDVLGLFFVQYAFWVGWLVLGVAAALAAFAVWRSVRQTSYDWVKGGAGAALLLMMPALLLWSASCVFDGLNHFQRLHHFDFLLAGAAVLSIGAVALATAAVERGRGRWILIAMAVIVGAAANLCGLNPVAIGLAVVVALLAFFAARDDARPAALWHGTLILLLVFATVAQALAPETAFVFAWPALVAALVAFVRTYGPRGHWAGGLLAMLAAVLVVAVCAVSGAFLFGGVGVDMPVVLVLAIFPALPAVLLVPGSHRLPLWAHGAVALAGVALFAFGRWAPPDAAHPTPGVVRLIADLDSGKAYLVAGFSTPDKWSRSALGTATRREILPWSEGRELWWSPAHPVKVPPSAVDIRREGGRMVVTVKPSAGAYEADLQIKASQAISDVQLDGRTLAGNFAPGDWNDIHVYAPDSFTVSFAPHGTGKIELALFTTYFEWPAGVASLPPKPQGVMGFSTSGSTQTVLQRRLRW